MKKTPPPTKKQIQAEVASLRKMKPSVRHHSFFGDDNHAAIEAQILVLEEEHVSTYRVDELGDKYDWNDGERSAARDAEEWRAGRKDSTRPSETWKDLVS